MNFVDPSGHCADPITGAVCLALVPAGPPGWVVDAVLVTVSVVLLLSAGHQAGVLLAEKVGKPLTPDEQRKVDRLNRADRDVEAFLSGHPNLEDEVLRKANGWQPGRREDHPDEAQKLLNGLQNAIDHLELVRRSRIEEAQSAIDAAVNIGKQAIGALKKKLSGDQK